MPEHDGARRAAAPGERPGARRQRRLALAAAAAVVLPAVAAGLPAARRAVAGLLGAASAETSSGVLRGERTDLDGARARAGFELVVPAFPDEVRLEPGGVVTFVYAARPGLPALRGGASAPCSASSGPASTSTTRARSRRWARCARSRSPA